VWQPQPGVVPAHCLRVSQPRWGGYVHPPAP
jgi:hypothetical protein